MDFSKERKPNKRNALQILLLFVTAASLLITFSYILYTTRNQPREQHVLGSEAVAPGREIAPTPSPTVPPPVTPKVSLLGPAVSNALAGSTGKYAVAVKNLTTGEEYLYNGHDSFATASLYKLWVMAVTYDQIQAGVLKKDQVLTESVSVLNSRFQIGSASAEKSVGTISQTVDESLRKMITLSDNYSAMLLTSKIRLSKVSAFLDRFALSESKIGTTSDNPTTTASDMALFFEELSSGKLANKEYTLDMLGLLSAQKLNSKIPKYLPGDIIIAHKTGELDSFTHDAGIISIPGNDYVIVVLSKSDYPPGAEERIAAISKNVYQYFASK